MEIERKSNRESHGSAADGVAAANASGSERRLKIGFFSQDCFAPCDFPVLPRLKGRFDLRWAVFFLSTDRAGFSESEFGAMATEWGVPSLLLRFGSRMRSPRTIVQYIRMIAWFRSWKPDILYVNALGTPWLLPLVLAVFGRRKVIWSLHDVVDHHDKSGWSVDAFYKRAIARLAGGCHLLSGSQKAMFDRLHPDRISYHAPHPPRDFGPGKVAPPTDRIRFMFFGGIHHYKGVDLLIDAAQSLWDRGVRGFEVVIAGFCRDWEPYRSRIRIPEIFKLEIRDLDNAEIPDLYAGSHWVVLPYRDVTQSGPLSSAIVYHRPVIVSDLPGFAEFTREGRTSKAFATEDAHDLSLRMEEAVRGGDLLWNEACRHVADLSEGSFSANACADAYARMFIGQARRLGLVPPPTEPG